MSTQFEATLTLGKNKEKTLWHPDVDVCWNYQDEHWEVTGCEDLMNGIEPILDTDACRPPGRDLAHYDIIEPVKVIPEIPRTKVKVLVEPRNPPDDQGVLQEQAESIEDMATDLLCLIQDGYFKYAAEAKDCLISEAESMDFGHYEEQ